MTRNKNETPEQREKRLEKQKLYYMKRKAAGILSHRDDKAQRENFSKRSTNRNDKHINKNLKRIKVYDAHHADIEGEIFDNTQLKIPIPLSLKAKFLEQKEDSLDENKAYKVFDFSEETFESQTSYSEDDKQSFRKIDSTDDDVDDFSSIICDVCKKKCFHDQCTLLRTNEFNETFINLLPEDIIDDISLILCPNCKIYINKSCLF